MSRLGRVCRERDRSAPGERGLKDSIWFNLVTRGALNPMFCSGEANTPWPSWNELSKWTRTELAGILVLTSAQWVFTVQVKKGK